MDNGGYTGRIWRLRGQLLIPQAVTALVEFRTRNALSEVDAVNWLLQFGGQCAEYARSGELVYRDLSGDAHLIVPLLGTGRPLA
jgi:hypothetical protein